MRGQAYQSAKCLARRGAGGRRADDRLDAARRMPAPFVRGRPSSRAAAELKATIPGGRGT